MSCVNWIAIFCWDDTVWWYLRCVLDSWVYVLGSKKVTGAIESSCKNGLFDDDGDNATHWWNINRYSHDICLAIMISLYVTGMNKINWKYYQISNNRLTHYWKRNVILGSQ